MDSHGRGVKRSKERLTVTPLVSASGKKLTVQIIGKSKTPRALRGIDINRTYNVVYDYQSKTWQDGSSMLRLLHRINREAKRCRQMFFVLLDNFSSHVLQPKFLIQMDALIHPLLLNRLRFCFSPKRYFRLPAARSGDYSLFQSRVSQGATEMSSFRI